MIEMLRGDCLELMGDIPDGSIDLIACDLPYGITRCRWDQVIPLDPLWVHYKRLLKPCGAVVLTGSQPFTSMLVMSNRKWFRYEWVWKKSQATGQLNSKRRPMPEHETILVFSPRTTTYNRQLTPKNPRNIRPPSKSTIHRCYGAQREAYERSISRDMRTPTSILEFNCCQRREHPTQKPVDLMEYLILTYSNEGETVLDNACGSATTLVACLNTNRHGIGIEKDPKIHATAERRIAEELARYPLLTG